MSKPFTFELVSPEKLLFSGQADMVVIPGEEGDFGVLAEHAPLISTVRPGTIRVYENGQVTQRIFVAGGFAEVTKDRCTMLADEAQHTKEIDPNAARQDFLKLNDEAATAVDGDHKRMMEKRLAIARARVAAAHSA